MTIAELNEEIRLAVRAYDPESESRLVFGDGKNDEPVLMLLGEAPGENEVKQGRPFVGKAGQNLSEFLVLAGLTRGEIWVSNAVKYRTVQPGKNGGWKNRTPSEQEIVMMAEYLEKEIRIVQPRVIVTLGNTPLRAVMGKGVTVGETHGRMLTRADGQQVFSLYHPAAIIYRRELKSVYEQDILRLKETVLNG